MSLGKTKLRRILSEETGIPVRDIIDYGRYKNFGNKERLTIGGHTIVAMHGGIKLSEPIIRGESIRYQTRNIKRAPINEAATSGHSGN